MGSVSTSRRDEGSEVEQGVVPSIARAVTLRAVGVGLAVIVAAVLWDEWSVYHFYRSSKLSRSHFPLEAVLKFAPSAKERARRSWARRATEAHLVVDAAISPNAAHGLRPPHLLLRALTAPALLDARMGF